MKHFFLFAVILTLVSSALAQEQKDSTEKAKYGISIGMSLNPFNTSLNKYYPYNQLYNMGVSPMTDYKEKIFLNSFHKALISPFIEFNYINKKRITYLFGLGYARRTSYRNPIGTVYFGDGVESRSVYFSCQMNYYFLKKPNQRSSPFVGIALYYDNKKYELRGGAFYSDDVYNIDEKSNLFIWQIPFGGFLNLGEYFFSRITGAVNIISYSQGMQEFVSTPGPSVFLSERITYSKFLFVNKLEKNEVLFPYYFQLTAGRKF